MREIFKMLYNPYSWAYNTDCIQILTDHENIPQGNFKYSINYNAIKQIIKKFLYFKDFKLNFLKIPCC